MNTYNEQKRQRRTVTVILTLAAMFVASAALAGPGRGQGPDGPHGKMGKQHGKQMHQRFKAKMAKVLRQDVGLDEGTALKVEQIHKGQHDQRKAAHKKMFQAKRALRTLINSDSNDQRAYEDAVAGLLQARATMHKLREQGFAEVRKILTPKQQGKLMFAMHKVKRMMHRGKGKRGGKHRGQRPAGPPEEDMEFDG